MTIRPTWRFAAGLRRLRDRDEGTVAIEFALIAPVLFMILIGTLSYGLYYGAANSVQQLAANAARASIAGLSDSERADIAKKSVADSAKSFMLIDPTLATVQAQPSTTNPDVFEVAVSYDASKLSLWAFNKLFPMPSKTIRRSSAIQRGGY